MEPAGYSSGGFRAFGGRYLAPRMRRRLSLCSKAGNRHAFISPPTRQSTKFDFSINLQTAGALGVEVPPGLLSIADKVIEWQKSNDHPRLLRCTLHFADGSIATVCRCPRSPATDITAEGRQRREGP